MPQWQWWRCPDVPDRCQWRRWWDRPDMIWQPGGWCKWSQIRRREQLQHHEPLLLLFPESRKWEKTLHHTVPRHMTEMCSTWRSEIPGRLQQRPSPNRKSARVKERLCSHTTSPHLCPCLSSPQTWTWHTPWQYLCVCVCVWGVEVRSITKTPPQIPRETFFHLLKRGNVNSHTFFSWYLGKARVA